MRAVLPTLLAAWLLTLAPIAASPAWAQRCGDEATQGATNSCFDRRYQGADAALNNTYRQVMARLKNKAEAIRRLVAAQRAWIGFRDAECAFVGSASDGSAQPMVLSQCLEALTTARTAALKGYLNCPEGDLSCPLPPP